MNMSHESSSSAAASPARTSAAPDLGPASTAPVPASGTSTSGAFTYFDPRSSSWRTCQGSLLNLDEFKGPWPRSGSMRNGMCSVRRSAGHRTCANDFSFSLPTPTASDSNGGANLTGREGGLNLRTAVRLLPTPTITGNHNRKGASKKSGDGLVTVLRAMLPTPLASDAKMGDAAKAARPRLSGPDGRRNFAADLRDVVAPGGHLSPEFVEWMMGLPRGWTHVGGVLAYTLLVMRSCPSKRRSRS